MSVSNATIRRNTKLDQLKTFTLRLVDAAKTSTQAAPGTAYILAGKHKHFLCTAPNKTVLVRYSDKAERLFNPAAFDITDAKAVSDSRKRELILPYNVDRESIRAILVYMSMNNGDSTTKLTTAALDLVLDTEPTFESDIKFYHAANVLRIKNEFQDPTLRGGLIDYLETTETFDAHDFQLALEFASFDRQMINKAQRAAIYCSLSGGAKKVEIQKMQQIAVDKGIYGVMLEHQQNMKKELGQKMMKSSKGGEKWPALESPASSNSSLKSNAW